MDMTTDFIYVMDIIGVIAFAVAGAMIAIENDMDLFGVIILALITCTGGGAIRDITVGRIPPMMFQDPVYIILSIITAVVVFCFVYWIRMHKDIMSPEKKKMVAATYQKLLLVTDSLGLAAFTVDGVYTGRHLSAPNNTNYFLIIFLGVVTGVGGSVLRDVCAMQKPYIFVRHIYAVASLVGAVAAALLPLVTTESNAQTVGFILVLLIRYLAAHFKLDLPRIPK